MNLKCSPCIYERLIGKPFSVVDTVLRTARDAITVLDGAALCGHHFSQNIFAKQQAVEKQQAALDAAVARARTRPKPPVAEAATMESDVPANLGG